MTNTKELEFLKEVLSEIEGIIKHAEEVATELGVEDAIVYEDVLDELEVLRESMLEKIEEYDD